MLRKKLLTYSTDKQVTSMFKKILIVFFLMSSNVNADSLTSLQIQMMQNRVIKSTNSQIIIFSVCNALFDVGYLSSCNGVNTWNLISSGKLGPDIKKLHDESQYDFDSTFFYKCGWSTCVDQARIRVIKHDTDSFKINIKISTNNKITLEPDLYKKYFDAIGNSLFISKTGIQLGAVSE